MEKKKTSVVWKYYTRILTEIHFTKKQVEHIIATEKTYNSIENVRKKPEKEYNLLLFFFLPW